MLWVGVGESLGSGAGAGSGAGPSGWQHAHSMGHGVMQLRSGSCGNSWRPAEVYTSVIYLRRLCERFWVDVAW